MGSEIRQTILKLLSPSWYETVVVAAIVIVAFFYFGIQIATSTTHQGYYLNQAVVKSETFQNISTISRAVNTSRFAGDAAVFIAWAAIGLVAYFAVDALLRSFRAFNFYVSMMEYFKDSRHQLEVDGFKRLLARSGAVVLLYAYIRFALLWLIPFIISLLHRVGQSDILQSSLLVFAAVTCAVVCVHIAVVLLRLSFLRIRLFGNLLS